ncbi:MAG: hypothetical protein WB404_00130 [Methanoregula sp.]
MGRTREGVPGLFPQYARPSMTVHSRMINEDYATGHESEFFANP